MDKKQQKAALNEAENEVTVIDRIKANKKLITGTLIFILLVAGGILIWMMVSSSHSKKADEAVAQADIELNDSIALEKYIAAGEYGHASGNRAKIQAAVMLYEQAKYAEALEQLKGASVDDPVIEAGALTLKGDCYVNLNQYDDALKAFKKALSEADENPEICPIVLIKMAHVYRAQENYAEEADAYKEIIDKYPTYGRETGMDMEKFYQRALKQSGK